MYRHTMLVKGSGHFPLDMLRYDCCFPADTDGVKALSNSWEDGEVEVLMVRYTKAKNDRAFTPARWQSFGWSCSAVDTCKVG